ncbi:MAG: hypothetical protein JW888_18340 [Pirellulales bacterium]|nr:hypothetical protein [Pirellulales bacterium]
MFTISLEPGYHVATMLAVAVAAMVLVAMFYRRAFAMLRARQWWLLLALRWVAVVLVVVLLFRPVLGYRKQLSQRPAVLLLVDASGSMSVADDATGVPRFAQVQQRVARWSKQLEADFDLQVMTFADRAGKLQRAEQLATLAADGQATSLSRAIRAVAAVPERPAAAILISDGLHNSARSPLDVAQRLGVVVHTVGVGATLRDDASYRDVQLTGIDCPDRLLLGNQAKIKASIEAVGLEGRVVQIILEDGSEQIAQTELTLDGVAGSQPVTFEFSPTEKGRHAYTVRAVPVAEERIDENNRRAAVALVVEPGIRVLYLEGTLRAEYGALVDRFLAKDPDLEFCALVQTRPGVFLTRANVAGLDLKTIPSDARTINTFDVFILGDLDSSFLRSAQQQLLIRRVRDGAGLIMLGGYHSLGPGGYGGTPLGQILPAAPGAREIGQITEPFLPELTPEGVRHPIFAGITGFFPDASRTVPDEAGLPPLEGCTRVGAARPGASVLAVCPIDSPAALVLAVQSVDRGRTAVFTGDTTRRWQQTLKALGQDSPFLRFWGQTVRWLAGRDESVEQAAGIDAAVDKVCYAPDEPVRISATVRDQQGQGTAHARVTAQIVRDDMKGATGVSPVPAEEKHGQDARGTLWQQAPGNRPLTLTPAPGPAGHYETTFAPEMAGTYQIELTAQLDGQPLTAEPLEFEVGRASLEFERLDLDEKMLQQIAQATGGRYAHLTTADELIEGLGRRQYNKTISFERRLYWPPLVWTLLVATLAAEWTLRRRFQLK